METLEMNDQERYLDCCTLSCADMEVLVNYHIDGELIENLRPRFDEHLRLCSSCQEMVGEYNQLVQLARTLNATTIPSGVRHRLREAIREQTGCDLTAIRPHLSVVKNNRSS